MKALLSSLIFNVVIAVLLVLGLNNPDGVAVNFIAVWALFGCLVCIGGSVLAAVSYEDWFASQSDPYRTPKHMAIFTSLIGKPRPLWRRFWSLILSAGTVLCLLTGGKVFIAFTYLLWLILFNMVRCSYRRRIKEAGLCPESL